MEFLKSKKSFENYRSTINSAKSIGFVPTMGALHQGHLSLFKESLKNNEITIGSVFINPTQFDNTADLKKYPNTIEKDTKMLEEIGVDALFFPPINDMYSKGLEYENIDLEGLDNEMEGAFRKQHFSGVVTIVKRLFELIQPTHAYFGEKDFQQLQIIKKMVANTKLPVTVIGMPIIREKNGLAMSSRNLRLSDKQKEEAKIIYQTLQEIKENVATYSPKKLIEIAEKNFKNSTLDLEYCIICDEETLSQTNQFLKNKTYRTFIAAYCGEIRLIDNKKIL